MRNIQELRQKRLELGMSQAQVGAYLGIPWCSVGKYERGERIMNDNLLEAYNRLLEGCIIGTIPYLKVRPKVHTIVSIKQPIPNSPHLLSVSVKILDAFNQGQPYTVKAEQEDIYPRTKEGYRILGDFI